MTATELAELKRLRLLAEHPSDEACPVAAAGAYSEMLLDHADELIAAVEECERLRTALTTIRDYYSGAGYIGGIARAALEGKP